MIERRKFERFEISISSSMELLGTFTRPLTVSGRTRNISLEGLSIELQEGEESLDLIPYLALKKKQVALEMKIPPKGERIRAIGRVMWYHSGSRGASYYFRAGLLLEEMEAEDRKKWEDFARTWRKQRSKGHQVGS